MTFAEIIGLWPTTAAFAESMGVPYPTAAAWKRRNSIPTDRLGDVLAAAARGGLNVTPEMLVHAGAPRRPEPADRAADPEAA